MLMIGAVGLILGIAALIILNLKGVNGLISAMVATIIVIITNGMNFWGEISGTFATGLGGFVTTYVFLFCLASAYGEIMRTSRSAEVCANWLFKIFGQKWAAVACMVVSFILAFGGINAFIIIFTVWPIAGPLFRKANISQALLPAIIMFGSIDLLVLCPGNPSNLIIALCNYLGTNSYTAPLMSIILLVIAFAFGAWYFTRLVKKNAEKGIGYIVKPGDEDLMEDNNADAPNTFVAFLPLILVVVVKTVLTNAMSATDGLLTAMLVAVGVAIICNYKRLKGHIIQDFTTGFWTSVNTLLVTGGIMGFAAVMKGAPGFAPFLAAAQWMAEHWNPYISAAISINVFSCITGACMAGTQMFVSTLGETFATMNLNTGGFMRMLAIAAMGLDTLPSSPVLINTANCCGVTVKECYKPVFMVTVVLPIFLTIFSIVLIYIGIV